MSASSQALIELPREHDVFVGLDSDGCVFDSMAAKQIQCFHRGFLEIWDLHAFEAPVRETLAFVNLYSAFRGRDRFLNLALAVRLMRERPELADAPLPDTVALEAWLAGEGPFGNQDLAAHMEKTSSEALHHVMAWSHLIDTYVSELGPIPPFDGALRFLEAASPSADVVVVSSTPTSVLTTEWETHGLRPYVQYIAGKEVGEKARQLAWATEGKGYTRRLMVGDAPKDLEAARAAGVAFFPMEPGREEACWTELQEEVLPCVMAGTYSAEVEEAYVARFLAALPEHPPWS